MHKQSSSPQVHAVAAKGMHRSSRRRSTPPSGYDLSPAPPSAMPWVLLRPSWSAEAAQHLRRRPELLRRVTNGRRLRPRSEPAIERCSQPLGRVLPQVYESNQAGASRLQPGAIPGLSKSPLR